DETGTLILGGIALQGIAAPIVELPPETPPEPPQIPPEVGDACSETDVLDHQDKLIAWHIMDCSEIITDGTYNYIDYAHDLSGQGNRLGGYDVSGNKVRLGN